MLRIRGKAAGVRDVGSSESQLQILPEQVERTPIGAEDLTKRALEVNVFGGQQEFLNRLDDRRETSDDSDNDNEEKSEVDRKPVWEDEDDAKPVDVPRKRKLAYVVDGLDIVDGKTDPQAYTQRLQKDFRSANERAAAAEDTPVWAQRKRKTQKDASSSDDSDDNGEDFGKRAGKYLRSETLLRKTVLDYKKLPNLTIGHKTGATITSVEFNKQARVALAAGYTQKLSIYQIDGKENPLLQSIGFKNCPIETAHFSSDGEKVVVGSKLKRFYYYYDMIAGKVVQVPSIRQINGLDMSHFEVSPDGSCIAFFMPDGDINLVSAQNHQWISKLKMNETPRAVAFSSTGQIMYSHGVGGRVYVWDMRRRVCIHKFIDEGCVQGSSLAVSTDNKFLATGSNTGVVNLYETSALTSSSPKPLKAFMNLTTHVDSLRFNPTSEILAMASNAVSQQLKLAHTASRTVYENFPVYKNELHRVFSVDMSLNGGYMIAGTSHGDACLYRLQHYPDY